MKTTHTLLTILLAILLNSYAFSQQQQLGNSFTVGLEAYRPWSVAPSGIASNPFSIRYSTAILPNWRIVIGLGWEQSVESGVEEINFSNQFEDGLGNTLTRSLNETTAIFDRAIGVQSGVRYLIPGGPERLRLFAGVDLLAAYYPERRIETSSIQRTVTQDDQLIESLMAETIGTGYEGYGFGVQGNLGLELMMIEGLHLGIEFGPGTFGRYRQVRHTFVTTGTRQDPIDPNRMIEFENENMRFEGEETASSQRFRGMLYVGWEF